MKNLLYAIIIVLSIVFCSQAKPFEIKPNIIVSTSSETTLSNVVDYEIQAQWHNILFFISQTEAIKRLVGQQVGDYRILGAGVGYTLPLVKHFSILGRLGYYQPKMYYKPQMKEAVYREMHRLSDPVDGWKAKPGVLCCEGHELDYDINTCRYETDSGFGGDIRLNLDKLITKRIRLSFFVGYRILELKTRTSANIKGLSLRPDGRQAFHAFSGKDNFSGGQAGIGITFRW